MHFSQKRELFLFPITTLLPSLIVRFLFVISLSACAARTIFCSSFLYLPVRLAPSFVRSLFVLCSFFVRSLFVLCSFFVRSLFVNYLSARVAHTAYRATTSHRFSFKACPPSGVRGLSSHCHSSLIWYF